MTTRSPLNIGRTIERNRRKQARSRENVEYRAGLHRQKSSADAVRKVQIQGDIDQISLRGGKK